MAQTLIHNARIVNEGTVTPGYVVIDNQMIAAVGSGPVPDEVVLTADMVIDANGRLLLPGIIDTHVHFRDPGLTEKADMATESAAAAAGGITSFIDMPNTAPATTTMALVEEKMARAADVATANYAFFIGATNSNLPELLAADYTRVAGVKVFLGSSTGNMLVDDDNTIRRIFAEVPALKAVHAEDEKLIHANRHQVLEQTAPADGDLPVDYHPVIRNHEVCFNASSRAVELARLTGARLHLLHVSTADELRLLTPGPVDDKLVTAETCPQYLLFSDENYAIHGTRIKCNPAIKHPTDREALRRAVASGLIDTIATDHAPHLLHQKQGGALKAVSGMPLIQFSLPLMVEFAKEGIFDIATVVEKMAHNPAKIFGIDRRGFIRPGYYADLVLVDDDCEPYTITDDMVVSRCGWTPLAGLTLSVKVDMTILNGHPSYRHGVVFSTHKGLPLKFIPKDTPQGPQMP